MDKIKPKWLGVIVKWASTRNWVFKLVASAFPGIGAVLLIFLRDPVFKSTGLGWDYIWNTLPQGTTRNDYSFAWLVFFYWLLIGIWLFAYVVFIYTENYNNKKSTVENRDYLDEIKSEINAAIHYAPNSGVFLEHKSVLEGIFDDIQLLESQRLQLGSDPKAMIEIYNTAIPKILERICELTKVFARHHSNNYSANIMVYIENTTSNKPLIEKLLENKDECIYFSEVKIEEIRGVLYTLTNLMAHIGNNRNIPSITLPIIKNENDGWILLPGAPKAALKGEAVVDKIDFEPNGIFSSLPTSTVEEAIQFFSGKGKDISSIVSISIPQLNQSIDQLKAENKQPFIGVINLDCDKTYLIGKEEKYYTTYYCLVKPIIFLLAPHIKNYYDMYDWEKIKNA